MKASITLILSVITILSANAQFVDKTPLKKIQTEYIQVTPEQRGNKIVIHIDYGQADQMFNHKDTQLRNADHEPYVFNSMIGALNYLNQQGFVLDEVYTLSFETSSQEYYILKRKT